jgi:hypothetical protein
MGDGRWDGVSPSVHELRHEAQLRLLLRDQERTVAEKQVGVRGQTHGLNLLQQPVFHVSAQAFQVDHLQSNLRLQTEHIDRRQREYWWPMPISEGNYGSIPCALALMDWWRTLPLSIQMKYFLDQAARAFDSCR